MNNRLINRRQLLRGHLDGALALRPPWAVDEALFTDLCTRCSDCVSACPKHILYKASAGFPEISFEHSGCDYCGECVSSCRTGALLSDPEFKPFPAQQHATVSSQCIASKGTVCRSCGEVCEHEAIQFSQRLGGVSMVTIDRSFCDGCGECVHVCPANAIKIVKETLNNE